MSEPLILVQDHGPVRRLVLNRGAGFNALSQAMIAALEDEIAVLARHPARVVVIAAAGKAFCAGHDLREMLALRADPAGGQARLESLFARCARMMESLTALPQPVIAEVQGVATAAGCQLVASCDLAVASEEARFGVNGINLGLFCATPMVALTRKIPPAIAFEMLGTGSFLPASRAAEVGLVNRVVAPEALTEASLALAETLAGKLGPALAMGKALFWQQSGASRAAAYDMAVRTMAANMMLDETGEGIAAFLERRPPKGPAR